MRIKLAILESDQNYLHRIVTAFNTKYADKLEIYSFTDSKIAFSTLESARIDVLIASDSFAIDVETLPKKCGFAYFVDSTDVDRVNDQRAICKYQKADLIYKQILSIYSEHVGKVSGLKLGDDHTKIVAFISIGCGAGASSMAAAAAIHYTAKNKKTLYLNLEKICSSDIFFSGEGQFDMSDIVFALKSKKINLPLKLESCVKQDKCGVYFYSQPKVALDMYELSADDRVHLLSELNLLGSYDYIVIDADFTLDSKELNLFRNVHKIVWVGDGSEISNQKIQQACAAFSVLEQDSDAPLTNRLCLVYNKFSNKTSRIIENIGIMNIGGAPRYEHATIRQVLGQLSKLDIFDKIF